MPVLVSQAGRYLASIDARLAFRSRIARSTGFDVDGRWLTAMIRQRPPWRERAEREAREVLQPPLVSSSRALSASGPLHGLEREQPAPRDRQGERPQLRPLGAERAHEALHDRDAAHDPRGQAGAASRISAKPMSSLSRAQFSRHTSP